MRKAARLITDPEYYVKLDKVLKDGAEKRKIEKKKKEMKRKI